MKKLGLALLAIFALNVAACDDDGGYVLMTPAPDQYDLKYLDEEWDALCTEAHGSNYLAFREVGAEETTYMCWETCSTVGSIKGDCETVDNKNYGLTDINTAYKCVDMDGKKIWMAYEFQHCNDACLPDKSACN